MRCTRLADRVETVLDVRIAQWRTAVAATLLLLAFAITAGCTQRVEATTVRPPCNPFEPSTRGNFVRWSRDGASIVFYRSDGLYRAAADGSTVRKVDTEVDTETSRYGWHAFDVSPDGERMVYGVCKSDERWGDADRFNWAQFELVRAEIDGAATKRLTRNPGFDNYPSWSPDGTRIAYVTRPYSAGSGGEGPRVLATMAVDGSGQRRIEIGGGTPESAAPQWSPDSQRLAVTAVPVRGGGRALYTVGADGSHPRALVRGVRSAPTWSPDGRWLAYARVNRGEMVLAAIRVDGTDERQLATIPDFSSWSWLRTVAWSPDGGHLLYSCGADLCVVATDGRPVGRTPLAMADGNIGAWSPDGSRFAVAGVGGIGPGGVVLYTMAPRDGELHILAAQGVVGTRTASVLLKGEREIDVHGVLAVGSGEVAAPANVTGCSGGGVVPAPVENPGLVADCQTLLVVRTILDPLGTLNWSADLPLAAWDGVTVAGTVPRVWGLDLADRELFGRIPAGLGRLTDLRTLNLSGTLLSGGIPPALDGLRQLRDLRLQWNYLGGPIPPRLGRLSQLRVLDLASSHVSGPIPRELGRLSQLRVLDLSGGQLTGLIPPELGALKHLETLNLRNNGLTGPIPVSLGEIDTLDDLSLGGNQLTGCLPTGFGRERPLKIDTEISKLPKCEPIT